jgi:hypothetical protein
LEKRKNFCLLSKSPRPKKGRIGPDRWQNWYHACVLTVISLLKDSSVVGVLIPSEFAVDEVLETDFYQKVFRALGLGSDQIATIQEGAETMGQLNAALKYAQEKELNLIVVWACREHYWRWRFIKDWLEVPKGMDIANIEHVINTTGFSRPKEFLTDLAAIPLIVFYRIWYGKRAKEFFYKKIIAGVQKRRADGKV